MKIRPLLFALFAAAIVCHAQTPSSPTDESLKELLKLTESEKLINDMQGQIQSSVAMSMDRVLQGQPLSDDQKAVVEKMKTKLTALMKDELGWAQMEGLYLQIYRESFTQPEIDQLIAFYKSPTGQMFVKKMPAIMQKSMMAMQQRMGPMLEKVKALQMETIQELKEEKASDKDATGGGGAGQ